MDGWRKITLFAAIIVGPALLIGYCNLRVFPDALVEATGMLAIGVVVCGVFTWQSRLATRRIERFCTIAALIVCAAMCVNLGGHWILSREISAARQGVEESNAQADREEKRRAAEVARELMITQAQIEQTRAEIEREHAERAKINAETRRLERLPVERRRIAIAGPQRPQAKPEAPSAGPSTPQPAPSVPVADTQAKAPAKLTPAEIAASWSWFLTVMAFIDCFLSVFAGGILFAVWEWDKNRDGIADHKQTPEELARGPQADPAWPPVLDTEPRNGGPGLGKNRPSW